MRTPSPLKVNARTHTHLCVLQVVTYTQMCLLQQFLNDHGNALVAKQPRHRRKVTLAKEALMELVDGCKCIVDCLERQ